MAHSFRMDAASAANCTHRNTTGLPSAASAWAFAFSFKISTFPASGKFLDVFGYRSQTASSPMSCGFEANNAGDFYYNREQGSPFTNISYTETIISTGGSTAFRRMFGTFGTNSQQVWTRSGGTSNQVINLTEALAFTILRGLFAADEVFPSDMGGVVDFDQVVLSTSSQTQGDLETQSDTRSLTLSNCNFYNDCNGGTAFRIDNSGNGNDWTQTGSTSDVSDDSWGSGSFTGTGSAAMSSLAASGSGTETFTSSGSAAMSSFAASGSGTVTYTGTASAALSPIAASGSSEQSFSATGSAALSPIAASGTGTDTNTGTGSAALSPLAASGSGTETFVGTGSAAFSPIAAAGGASDFPLTVHASGRYFLTTAGRPFRIKFRASWNLLQETLANIEDYLDDTVSLGFNGIEMRLISSDGTTTSAARAQRAPFANNGALLPFTKKLDGNNWDGSMPPTAFSSYPNINNDAPDFTQTTSAYWSFVDDVLAACATRGLLVLAFPAYVGFKNTNQGWMSEMVANGTTKMETYGAFVADRYKNLANIVWMIGGDTGTGADTFTAPQIAVEQALIDGMLSVSGQASVSVAAEWNTESYLNTQTDIDFSGFATRIQSAYSFTGDIATVGRAAYTEDDGPAIGLEYPYDEEGPDGTNVNAAASQPVRRYSWWAWLSTIGGYGTGNGFVWPFDLAGAPDDLWSTHLATTGASNLAILNTFIETPNTEFLVPSGLDGMRSLIPSGGGTGPSDDNYVAAACAANGTLLVAYVPPANASACTFTVDLRSMVDGIRARWFDPTAGTYSTNASAAGTFTLANTASAQSFTTPAANDAGEHDWVLVLDTADVAGSGSAALSPFGASGTGTITYTGTGSAAASSLAASGDGTNRFEGTGSAAMSPLGASGTGGQTNTGTGSAALARIQASGRDAAASTTTGWRRRRLRAVLAARAH